MAASASQPASQPSSQTDTFKEDDGKMTESKLKKKKIKIENHNILNSAYIKLK